MFGFLSPHWKMLRTNAPCPAAFLIFSLTVLFRSQWTTKSLNPCSVTVPQTSYKCMEMNLSRIPLEIPNTTQSLDLSYNPLEILTSNYFSWLFALKYLDLTRCDIQEIEDDTFVGLHNLSTLILTGNPLKFLGPRAFHDLPSLQRLIAVETKQSSLDSLPIGHLISLQELNLKNNDITSLKLPRFFTNLTCLQHLDLQSNKISCISRGDLDALSSKNLTLVLSRNDIKVIETNAFADVILQKLILRGCFENSSTLQASLQSLNGLHVNSLMLGDYRNIEKLESFSKSLLDALCHINLQEITLISIDADFDDTSQLSDCLNNISNVRFVHLLIDLVQNFPSYSRISFLEFKNSRLKDVPAHSLSSLKELRVLSMTQNKKLEGFDEEFKGLQKLEKLDLSNNQIKTKIYWHPFMSALPHLKYLNLSFNNEVSLSPECSGSSELETMDLQHTTLSGPGMYPVFLCLSRLVYLDISYTSIKVEVECSFCGLDNLKVLKMAGNSFLNNFFNMSFSNLAKLQILDISNCRLQNISLISLADLKELRELNISNNNLLKLPSHIFGNLHVLSVLDFHKNQLVTLTEKDLVNLTRSLKRLDLSQNMFDCSCENLNFLKWARENRRLLQHSENMICHSPAYLEDVLVLNVDLSCKTYTTIVAVSTTVALVLVLSLILVYKYYFHLYYMVVLVCGGRPTTENNSVYDAFVIYSSEDQEWVKQELEDKLEKGVPRFSLCLFYRDFIPGVSIITNIIKEGFQRSRKVIAVVSSHFLESHWCNFELEVAQSWQLLDRRSKLVIIILEDVDKAAFQQKLGLFRYLRRNTYLVWKDWELNRHLFLRQLRSSLLEGKTWTEDEMILSLAD